MNQPPRDSGSWTSTNGDIAFLHSRLCQSPRPAWGKSKWKRFIMAIPQENAGITPKPATRDRLGKIRRETVYLGVHAFFRWRSCQNRRAAWGNSYGNPFIMAISPIKAALTPKLAGAWGKSKWKPFILAIAKKREIRSAKPFGSAKRSGLAKQRGMALGVGAIDDNRPYLRVSPFRAKEGSSPASTRRRRPPAAERKRTFLVHGFLAAHAHHSYRKASIGSRRLARRAG